MYLCHFIHNLTYTKSLCTFVTNQNVSRFSLFNCLFQISIAKRPLKANGMPGQELNCTSPLIAKVSKHSHRTKVPRDKVVYARPHSQKERELNFNLGWSI